ncbi:MAG TPA: hypothetical protein VF331_24355 [Polyangiales bacterium]
MPSSLAPTTLAHSTIERLLPREFVSVARSVSLREFVSAYGDSDFLLVKLDDDGELLAGLQRLATERREAGPDGGQAIGTQTAMEYSLHFEDSQRCCRGWIGVEATELFRFGP